MRGGYNGLTATDFQSTGKFVDCFTEKFLELLDFNWNIIDELYIQKYINYLKSIKFI